MVRSREVALPDLSAPERSRLLASKLIIFGPLIAVAGGRWGSYLGVPGAPIYFADLSVGLGIALLTVSVLRRSGTTRSVNFRGTRQGLTVASVCMAGILIIGFGGGFGGAGVSLSTIRDAIPFVYFLLIPVFASAIQILGVDMAIRWIRNAAVLHTVWFVPAVLGFLGEVTVPLIAGAPVFGTRGDYDVLICGLAVVTLIAGPSVDSRITFLLIAANIAGALASGSRAGLIAAVLVVSFVAVARRPFRDPGRGPLRLAFTSFAMIPLIMLAIWTINSPPAWAVGIQKLIPNDSATYQSGQNTAGARVDAWRLVVDYVSNQDVTWFGFGFGSNPILDSGAVRYLSGDPAVRAAHNFGVTWFAFTGLAGLILLGVALVAWFTIAAKNIRSGPPAALIGTGLMSALVVAGLIGVIMESPFGYTTFAMAVGLVVAGGDGRGIYQR